MKTEVYPADDAEEPITDADVVNVPRLVYVAAEPPDDIAFLVPLPGGKYAKCLVDAQELEAVLELAHEKLIEAEADLQPPPAPEPAAPDEVLATNAVEDEEQPGG